MVRKYFFKKILLKEINWLNFCLINGEALIGSKYCPYILCELLLFNNKIKIYILLNY